ncbi:MAG TPA: hypothetical protein VK623_03375 [Flavobacterium sp.]|nr:hypothetical protein [Flavobacterium sp.]
MIAIKKEGVILRKTNLEFENEGVLNPAVILDNGQIHLFYRAVSKGNHSTIGYCRLSDPLTIAERFDHPVIVPENEYEVQGVEDPRIVKIDGAFYLSYTAYDGFLALGALAISHDLENFTKVGLIVPQVNYKDFRRMVASSGKVNLKYFRFDQCSLILWDKNVIFFPRRINKKLVFMHRIRPGIQIVSIDNIDDLTDEFWKNYFLDFANNILLDPKCEHETSYIGGGCPPIETEYGWLLIYHSVKDTINGYIYAACVALLDLEDPRKEIARLPYPLFSPEYDWELNGEVNNVCFPTGTVLIDDKLYIYYGAADEQIACASVSKSALLKELLKNTTTK